MKTQLIILEQGNIIVSDEKIDYEKDTIYYPKCSTGKKKIIASDNPEHNLPSIDYSHPIEKDGVIKTAGEWLGIVDVRKIANDRFIKLKNNGSDTDLAEIASEEYALGFKKAQSLNDKKFSLEDMKRAYYAGRGLGKLTETHDWDCFEKSLNKPKVFNIEVEMETICNNCGDIDCTHSICKSHIVKDKGDSLKPKITNNSIKITKVIV